MSKPEHNKFSCDQCEYKATQRSHLLTHIKSIHEGIKYPCEQCNFKATQKHHLLTHIKLKHEGVKYPCDQCDCKGTHKHSQHLDNVHKMTMVQYHDGYEEKRNFQQTIVKRCPKKQEIKKIMFHKNKLKSPPSLPARLPCSKLSHVKFPWIYKDMIYKCKDCEQDLLELEGIKVHFKTFHNTKFLHGIRPSPSLTNISSYICKIGSCKEEIEPFYDKIKQHLRVHQLTVLEYHRTCETQVQKEDKMANKAI